MKFNLVDGEVRFLTHKVEWQERGETQTREFYDPAKKDAFVTRLQERDIEYTVTKYDPPSQEIRNKVSGKKFNTIEEARQFIESDIEPVTLESLAEIVADIIGGAI